MPSSRPAYSLIFAFIIMTVLMLVAGSAVQNTNDKLALYNELEGSTQAYLNAASAAELGIVAMKDEGPGFEISDSLDSTDLDANYTVFARGREDPDFTGFFYTPIFGTGSAGVGEDCSVLDYLDPATGEVRTGVDIDLESPCHWNKLSPDQGVSIPLFYTDSSGNVITPAEIPGFNGWSLKVRTPCKVENEDGSCEERYAFNLDGEIAGEGDTVLFWRLTAEGGTEETLIPNDDTATDFTGTEPPTRSSSYSNTEIYESLINDADVPGDHVVLTTLPTGEDRYAVLEDFCLQSDLTNLFMQLDIVTQLKDDTGMSIPYLEWQLQVDAEEAFADNKSIVLGEGYAHFLDKSFYYAQALSRSTTGESSAIYTLSN